MEFTKYQYETFTLTASLVLKMNDAPPPIRINSKMTSQFLHTIVPSTPCTTFPEEPSITYSFPLDPFQQHAISAIHRNENVLVTAKTGSGKTLVGEYQIAHALAQGKKVFYTTPIKSLSNQKFHDLKAMWPGRVGIMTGDIKFQPNADIVIMTTEILRNLLFKHKSSTATLGITASLSLENLGAVVFDEVHYINNKERGRVWEETMILLPREVNLVLLSATIDGPQHFAAWLGELKQKPIHLISTLYRIVPLTHTILQGKTPHTIMDHKDIFYAETYNNWLKSLKQEGEDYKKHKDAVHARRLGGYEDPVVTGTKKPATFQNRLNETLTTLYEREQLPALVFSFSRKQCERLAARTEGNFLTSSESASVGHILSFHLSHYPAVYKATPQYFTLAALLEKGVAFHHSGVIPILKEIIEILFAKGLVKVLYATETFAVGINMPTKTVLFTAFEKYDGDVRGLRVLQSDEYIQMAGRAGRRGKDKEGLVIYLPEREPLDISSMKTMLTGSKPTFQSRMSFHYDFILKTIQSQNTTWMDLMERSYWREQQRQAISHAEKLVKGFETQITAISLRAEEEAALQEREILEKTVREKTNKAKKEAQRKLERWLDEHRGPIWESAERKWRSYQELQKQLSRERQTLEDMQAYKEDITPLFNVLRECGYMEEDSLTELGTIATEINEGHALLLSYAYKHGYLDTLTGEEILCVLAAFLEEKEEEAHTLESLQISSAVRNCLYKMDDSASMFLSAEKRHGVLSPSGFWNLGSFWIEPLAKWLQGETTAGQICTDYEMYEGNFIRGILKAANILEELTNIAIFTKNVEMLHKLDGLQARLVRDIVVPESLYLRL